MIYKVAVTSFFTVFMCLIAVRVFNNWFGGKKKVPTAIKAVVCVLFILGLISSVASVFMMIRI